MQIFSAELFENSAKCRFLLSFITICIDSVSCKITDSGSDEPDREQKGKKNMMIQGITPPLLPDCVQLNLQETKWGLQ